VDYLLSNPILTCYRLKYVVVGVAVKKKKKNEKKKKTLLWQTFALFFIYFFWLFLSTDAINTTI